MPDRDSVINDLNVAKRILCNPQMLTPEMCIRIGQAITSAIALLKEQEHGWIPVSERLPEDGSDILVYCDDGEESRITACNYDNGVWFDCVFNTVMVFKNITHWMTLPKAPKKDGDGDG